MDKCKFQWKKFGDALYNKWFDNDIKKIPEGSRDSHKQLANAQKILFFGCVSVIFIISIISRIKYNYPIFDFKLIFGVILAIICPFSFITFLWLPEIYIKILKKHDLHYIQKEICIKEAVCHICGQKEIFTNHIWSEGAYESPNSCVFTRYCTKCSFQDIQVIHDWSEWSSNNASENRPKNLIRYCKRCSLHEEKNLQECPSCKGKGHTDVICSFCDGTMSEDAGWWDYKTPYTVACINCFNGYEKCNQCEGRQYIYVFKDEIPA